MPSQSSADKLFLKLSSFGETLERSDFLEKMLKACCLVTLAISSLRFAYIEVISEKPFLADFNAFYLAGHLALQGKLAIAYHFQQMQQAQFEFYGIKGGLAWNYPPPFDLVVVPLAIPPIGVSSFLFSGFSLVGYLRFLDPIAGEARRLIKFIMLPTILLNLCIGQNGFLTGMLLCSFCGLTLKRSPWAGIPLGLMIIKPHLALGFGLFSLIERNGRTLGIAAVTGAVFAGLSAWILGPEVWREFAEGIQESALLLKAGIYPLSRMTSVFASAYTLTDQLALSQLIQAVSIILGIICLCFTVWLRAPLREQLGMVALTSPFFSPYFYDYDLPIVGIGMALLYPAMTRHLKASERIIAITCLILAESGWIVTMFLASPGSAATLDSGVRLPSLAAPMLLITLFSGAITVWRAHALRRMV